MPNEKLISVLNEIREIADILGEVYKENAQNAQEMASGYEKIIKQMQSGEPIYLEQGAKWDENTMPKKKENQYTLDENGKKLISPKNIKQN